LLGHNISFKKTNTFFAAVLFCRRFSLHQKTFADGKFIFILGSNIPNSLATFSWGSRNFLKDIGSIRVQISAQYAYLALKVYPAPKVYPFFAAKNRYLEIKE
jgi:hypothetical protein